MSTAPDAKEEYDRKKKFLEDLKTLDRAEQEELFRILKANQVEFSENSNGIFFDITPISSAIFEQMSDVVKRSKEQRVKEKERSAMLEGALKSVVDNT